MELDYKDLKACELCHKSFSLTRHKHKCKRCKLIICSDCGKTKSIIIGYKGSPTVPHRVCRICREDINFQADAKNLLKTSWATQSQLGKDWLNKCNVEQELNMNIQEDYQRYLSESETSTDLKSLITDLTDDLKQGRADRESFNYSLTEFFFYCQDGKKIDVIRKNVENVLRAFYACHPEQGYTTILINVATLLLCFTDEETAFYLLCYINQKIVPEHFWDKNSSPLAFLGLIREKYIVEKAAISLLYPKGSQEDLRKFDIVFKKIANVMIGGLLVDTVNVNTLVQVWNEMFAQKSIKAIETNILKVFQQTKTFFNNFYNLSLHNYRTFACRNVQGATLKADTTQFSEENRTQLNQEFDDKALDEIVKRQETLINSINVLKKLKIDDVGAIVGEIRDILHKLKVERKMKVTFIEMTQPTFIKVLRKSPYLDGLQEQDLVEIFESLDFTKDGAVSSIVLAGLLILLISNDLKSKLSDVFSLFDVDGDKQISKKEMPQVINFLAQVLPILNESDPTYLIFQVHLYEMLEKLRKKVKKLEKTTVIEFQTIVSEYPVFQVVTGTKNIFVKRSDSMVSYNSVDDNMIDDSLEEEYLRRETTVLPESLMVPADGEEKGQPDLAVVVENDDDEPTQLNRNFHVDEIKVDKNEDIVNQDENSASVVDQPSSASPGDVQDFELVKEEEAKKEEEPNDEVVEVDSPETNSRAEDASPQKSPEEDPKEDITGTKQQDAIVEEVPEAPVHNEEQEEENANTPQETQKQQEEDLETLKSSEQVNKEEEVQQEEEVKEGFIEHIPHETQQKEDLEAIKPSEQVNEEEVQQEEEAKEAVIDQVHEIIKEQEEILDQQTNRPENEEASLKQEENEKSEPQSAQSAQPEIDYSPQEDKNTKEEAPVTEPLKEKQAESEERKPDEEPKRRSFTENKDADASVATQDVSLNEEQEKQSQDKQSLEKSSEVTNKEKDMVIEVPREEQDEEDEEVGEFGNREVIKVQINPADRNVKQKSTKALKEKEQACKLCNIF